MPDGFSVDLGALENAAAGVNATMSAFREHRVAELGGVAADFGHDGLATASAGFAEAWQRGVETLAADGQQVASRLSQSVAAYLRVDQAATGMFDGTLTRPGDDPGVR